MKVIRETIGETTILVETIDEPITVVGDATGGRATRPTGIGDRLVGAFAKVNAAVRNVAKDFGASLSTLDKEQAPSEVELCMSLAFSGEGELLWVFSGKAEAGLKVTLKWRLSDHE